MVNWLNRLVPQAGERKMMGAVTTLAPLAGPHWSRRGYQSLVQLGFMRNPVAYRAIRLVAESAASVPLAVEGQGGGRLNRHPLLARLARPNARQSGGEWLETLFCHLLTSGNAYARAGLVGDGVGELQVLRPDRMRVLPDALGYPRAYEYAAGGRALELRLDTRPVAEVLHLGLFHPLDDQYGFAPLEAAAEALDIHNAASGWNKALLDNAARPSGALIAGGGQPLTDTQFRRLKGELESNFQGAQNAGRPLVLDGGLEWKPMALTPAEMDFLGLKEAAARDIALAFGVPPQLLGIPGDNTYASLAEANKALWRHTIVPLVKRVVDDLSFWLSPAFEGARLVPDFEHVEALSEDRAALWARVSAAAFLRDDEKRAMLGV